MICKEAPTWNEALESLEPGQILVSNLNNDTFQVTLICSDCGIVNNFTFSGEAMRNLFKKAEE